MNVIDPPRVQRLLFSGGDDLDALLRGFFEAQLPRPWPALKPPAPSAEARAPLPSQHRRPRSASRWALAASVALLLGGQVWLTRSGQDRDVAERRGHAAPVDVASPPHKKARFPDRSPALAIPSGNPSSVPAGTSP